MPEAAGPGSTRPAPSRPAQPGTPAPSAEPETLADRVRAAASGLEPLVAQAEAVRRQRATSAAPDAAPRWTDVFTTQFTEFSNRPR